MTKKKRYKIGERVWFLKSMRMCRVVEDHGDGYTVEILDSGKLLFATSDGLARDDELTASLDADDA